MKRRFWLALGTLCALVLSSGVGRQAAAYGYTLPHCIFTHERAEIGIAAWFNWTPGSRAPLPGGAGNRLPTFAFSDEAEGDHWSVVVKEYFQGEEVWRREKLGPGEQAWIPASALKQGELYEVTTERWLKDGGQSTGSSLVEITDGATVAKTRGHSISHSNPLYYELTTEGAVEARLTLKVDGAVIHSSVVRPHTPVNGWTDMSPTTLQFPLDQIDARYLNKQVTATWEELDSEGRSLLTATPDYSQFTLRPSLKPTWQQGGGQVIGPDGTIAWEPVEGAHWYQLSVSGNGEHEEFRAVIDAKSTQFQFANQLKPGLYSVHLAADGGGCRQDWGEALRLVVDEEPFRVILSPAMGATVDGALSVKLRRADWIESYQVDLFDAQTEERLATQQLPAPLGDTVSFSTKRLVPGRTYRLRATATLRVPVAQVDEVTFTYQPPVKLGFKEALQGARLAKADLPLSWEPIPGAQSYTLLLTRASGFINLQTRHPVGDATSGTLRAVELESGRSYRLALEVTMADGTKRVSDPVTFTIQ